jgi:hypothetical protein
MRFFVITALTFCCRPFDDVAAVAQPQHVALRDDARKLPFFVAHWQGADVELVEDPDGLLHRLVGCNRA